MEGFEGRVVLEERKSMFSERSARVRATSCIHKHELCGHIELDQAIMRMKR